MEQTVPMAEAKKLVTRLRQAEGGRAKAEDAVAKYKKLVDQLTSPPMAYGTVIAKHGKTLTLMTDRGFHEILQPKNCKVKIGATVPVVSETLQIIDSINLLVGGEVAYYKQSISSMDGNFSEVDYQSTVKVVATGECLNKPLKKGDMVLLDRHCVVIIQNLGSETKDFCLEQSTGITWDDIGGLAEAKQQIIEAVEMPHKYPDIFKYYNKKPVKGILLYGPPGCGKTMLGKAIATSLASIYGNGNSNGGFLHIKGPEILDRYVGVSEAKIRQVFKQAADFKEVSGYPAIIFIDEADAIMYKRGSRHTSDMDTTIVPAFLAEMDGISETGAMVILATNRPDILDPAIIRDGRIQHKIEVGRPTSDAVLEIFISSLQHIPVATGSYKELSKIATKEVFSNRRIIYQIHTQDSVLDFTLGDMVSGSMIVNVIEKATSIALNRDLAKKVQTGIVEEDILSAINSINNQALAVDNTDIVSEFTHDFEDDIVKVEKYVLEEV